MGDLDPTMGTLTGSQKDRLDKMKSQANNPLKAYKCKKKKNKNYCFLVAKDSNFVVVDCCSCCMNKACSLIRCKKCCVQYCFEERKMRKCKDHIKGMKEKKKELEDLANLAWLRWGFYTRLIWKR